MWSWSISPACVVASFWTFQFSGDYMQSRKTSAMPFMLSPSLSFPWGQLFYLREPYREISNSIALFFWPLIPNTYSCLITSCSNSQENNEIAPGCRCQLLAKADCTFLYAPTLFCAVFQPVSLEVCFCETQTLICFRCEFIRSELA